MAEGVRIYHPGYRDITVSLESARPYKSPFNCPLCQKTHTNKTYHIKLDSDGESTVSPEVFARLQELGMGGFVDKGADHNPPTIVVGLSDDAPPQEIVVEQPTEVTGS